MNKPKENFTVKEKDGKIYFSYFIPKEVKQHIDSLDLRRDTNFYSLLVASLMFYPFFKHHTGKATFSMYKLVDMCHNYNNTKKILIDAGFIKQTDWFWTKRPDIIDQTCTRTYTVTPKFFYTLFEKSSWHTVILNKSEFEIIRSYFEKRVRRNRKQTNDKKIKFDQEIEVFYEKNLQVMEQYKQILDSIKNKSSCPKQVEEMKSIIKKSESNINGINKVKEKVDSDNDYTYVSTSKACGRGYSYYSALSKDVRTYLLDNEGNKFCELDEKNSFLVYTMKMFFDLDICNKNFANDVQNGTIYANMEVLVKQRLHKLSLPFTMFESSHFKQTMIEFCYGASGNECKRIIFAEKGESINEFIEKCATNNKDANFFKFIYGEYDGKSTISLKNKDKYASIVRQKLVELFKDEFVREYGSTYDFICKFKTGNYKRYANVIMRLESKFMYDEFIPEFIKEFGEDTNFLTIHDGVLVPVTKIKRAEEIFKDVAKNYMAEKFQFFNNNCFCDDVEKYKKENYDSIYHGETISFPYSIKGLTSDSEFKQDLKTNITRVVLGYETLANLKKWMIVKSRSVN